MVSKEEKHPRIHNTIYFKQTESHNGIKDIDIIILQETWRREAMTTNCPSNDR